MIWLLWVLLTLPLRIVVLVVKIIRLVGLGRIVVFGAGVATGMAAGPDSGAALRSRVRGARQRFAATGGDLAAVVRHELANSPRTWHLDQPEVAVTADGRIVLRGTVPNADARADLVRTAGAVAGVRGVDARLDVDSDAG